jgi:WD40 repeat protein
MLLVRRVALLTLAVLLPLAPSLRAQPTNRTEVTALLYAADGKTLTSAGLDGSLRKWDAVSGKELQRVEAHPEGVWGAALSADGKLLATAGADSKARIWDAAKLTVLKTFEGHTKDVIAVAFSPDGKTLASGGLDKAIRLWDVASGKERLKFHGHELRVTGLAFSPDGKTLASAGTATAVLQGFFVDATHADTVRLWDVATGKAIRELSVHGTMAAFAPDGQTVVGGGLFMTGKQTSAGGGVSLHGGARVGVSRVSDGKELLSIHGQGGAAAFSSDGKFLATAWGSRQHLGRFQIENEMKHRRVALWELATGKEVLQLNEDGAVAVAVSPDGKRLAAGRFNGSVGFHDLKPGGLRAEVKPDMLSVGELERRWNGLAEEDPAAAYESIWLLSEAREKTVAYLKERLVPVPPAGEKVRQLLADLDSKRFAAREAAFRALKKMGSEIEPELRRVLHGQPPQEMKQRIQTLLERFEKHPASPEELRQTRAVQILERIGTAEARAVLTRLAGGAPGVWLTVEAQNALQRLARRDSSSP